MTLPTKLTILRILLTFLIMALLFAPGPMAKGWCLGLFLLAAVTDWWDGLLARRLNQISALGVLLDPIADKIFVLGLLLVFVQLRLLPAWMVLVVLIRELLITGIRLYAVSRQVVIPAAREGKHKTISQMLTILLVLSLLFLRDLLGRGTDPAFEGWMSRAILWAMWVTVALTVYSGATFFWKNRTILHDAVTR